MATAIAEAFYDKGKVILVEPLGRTVELGSIGYFDKGQWIEVSTVLKMFKLEPPVAPGSSQPNSFDGKAGKKLKVEAKANGEISTLVPNAPAANARTEITFGSAGAFVMSVRDQSVRTYRQLGELMAAIRFAYKYRANLPAEDRWQESYAVIVGIASAKSATALASSSKDGTAVISGSGKSAAPAVPVDMDASLSVSYSKDSVDKLWEAPAEGYAFQALRIKPSIFKRWDEEDLVYVSPSQGRFGIIKRKGRGESTRNGKVQRPESYARWATKAGLVVPPSSYEQLTAADTASSRPSAKKAKPSAKKAKKKARKRRSR